MLNDSKDLLKQLGAQGFDKERVRYIEKLLIAMKTSIETLCGAEIPFKEKFLRLYDVDLQPVNESELDNLLNDFNKAYKGTGSLDDRLKVLREKRKVPEDKAYQLFKEALNIARMKTKELFGDLLPETERILIELVKEKDNNEPKWAYYEWYLGKYISRIEVNPRFNVYWSSLLSAATHEGYPGHHTEFAVKEQRLYRELYQFEHSVLLLNSPKLIISEGIANMAVNVLFSYHDQAEISLNEFCRDKSIEDSIDIMIEQYRVKRKIDLFLYDLAFHALIDEWSKEKLFRYGISFEIFSKESIDNRIKLLKNTLHSTTTVSYLIGSTLITDKYGEFPTNKDFMDLLTKPFLPSDLI